MTLTTSIEKVSRSAVRKDGLTSDEISIVNCSIEWLEQHENTWRHYGTIAEVTLIEGAPHALIIRAEDAHTEYQPVQDVIEGDTMRLGKRIGENDGRGRKGTRHGHKKSRSHAPTRTKSTQDGSPRLPTLNDGGLQSPTSDIQKEGDLRSTKSNTKGNGDTTVQHKGSRTQGSTMRATQQQPDGPGFRKADGKRNGARPGKTNPADHSGKHRRPAQKVAGGRQTGDVAAPDD